MNAATTTLQTLRDISNVTKKWSSPHSIKDLQITRWSEYLPIYRIGAALYLPDLIHQVTNATPLELMLSFASPNQEAQANERVLQTIHAAHPTLFHEELYRMKDPGWRLTQVVDPQQHDDATRLFLALYAIRTRKVFSRPQRDHMGLYAVKNTLEHIFPNLSDNTLALQLVCASNPALGSLWVHQKEHQGKAVDMMALELLAYQDRYTLTRKHYARMSDDEFIMWVNPKIQQELAFSSMRDNNKRNSYPKEKIPLLYEHNPWLYVVDVVLNDDARNAENMASQWFEKMLLRASERFGQTNFHGTIDMLRLAGDSRGKKYFDLVIQKYAPSAYKALEITSLMSNDLGEKITLWVQMLGSNSFVNHPVPSDLFEEHPSQANASQ